MIIKVITATIISILSSLFLLEFSLQLFRISPDLSREHFIGNTSHNFNGDTIVDYKYFYQDSYYESVINKEMKIIAIGDSFTWGYPVDTAYKYPVVLERLFNHEEIGVLNMGLADSGPDQHLKIFQKHVLPRMKPEVVVWQFYPNDSLNNADFPLYSLSDSGNLVLLDGKRNWLYKRDQVYRMFSFLGKYREKSLTVRWILAAVENGFKYREVPEKIKDLSLYGRDKIRKEVELMNKLAEENDFKVYYALIAPQLYYDSTRSNENWVVDEYIELYKILSLQQNFIAIDFSDHDLIATSGDKILGVYSGSSNSAYLFQNGEVDRNPYGDRHFSEVGYSKMAELIYQKIVSSTKSSEVNFISL